MVVPDQHQLAWMAGVFEGEGNIYVSEPDGKRHGVLEVSVGNCDREIVEPFHERYGGSFRENNPGRPDGWRECLKWSVAAKSAVEPLRELRPHIRSSTERERIDLALKIQAVKDRWPVPMGERDQYRDDVKMLVGQLRSVNGRRG